jgi:hypothetical protein
MFVLTPLAMQIEDQAKQFMKAKCFQALLKVFVFTLCTYTDTIHECTIGLLTTPTILATGDALTQSINH